MPTGVAGAQEDDNSAKKYTYSFSVWPSETWGFKRQIFILFEMLQARVDLDMTEGEFEWFKSMLNHDGMTLREVTRVPYHVPEII